MKNNEEYEEYEEVEDLSELDYQTDLNTRKIQAYAIIGLVGVVAILLIIYLIKSFKPVEEETKEDKPTLETRIEKRKFEIKREPEKPKEEEKESLIDLFKTNINNNESSFTPNKKEPLKAVIIKGGGSTLINHKKVSETSQKQNINKSQEEILKLESDKSFQGDTFVPTIASVSKFNPNLLLPKGTYIGCSLKTKIVSTIKGGVACIVSNNVYSENGNVLLIEKGSTITGMFKSAEMNDGMDRLFVIWQEIKTPKNIKIPVYSGATDELGASGIHGWVDHKWLMRFGSAILLSIVDDTFAVLANKINKDKSFDKSENSRETTQKMAEVALNKFINIKPTLYKNQGDLVGVYVNRDIDFSKVYKLSRKVSIKK